jgi:hypothetical protein
MDDSGQAMTESSVPEVAAATIAILTRGREVSRSWRGVACL